MWFKMKSWDLASAEKGKYCVTIEEVLPCSSAKAFDAFRGNHIHKWFPEIKSTNWISDTSEQVDALRQVNLIPMSVKERFLIWEPNKRFTFYVEAATLPLLNAMIEDCIFENLGNNRCKFTWNIYFEPNWFASLLSPVTQFIYQRMFSQATKGLKKYVK